MLWLEAFRLRSAGRLKSYFTTSDLPFFFFAICLFYSSKDTRPRRTRWDCLPSYRGYGAVRNARRAPPDRPRVRVTLRVQCASMLALFLLLLLLLLLLLFLAHGRQRLQRFGVDGESIPQGKLVGESRGMALRVGPYDGRARTAGREGRIFTS